MKEISTMQTPRTDQRSGGCVAEISCLLRDFLVRDMEGSPIRLANGGTRLCQTIKFLNGIAEKRRLHSQVRSSLWTMLGDAVRHHQNADGGSPLPPL